MIKTKGAKRGNRAENFYVLTLKWINVLFCPKKPEERGSQRQSDVGNNSKRGKKHYFGIRFAFLMTRISIKTHFHFTLLLHWDEIGRSEREREFKVV